MLEIGAFWKIYRNNEKKVLHELCYKFFFNKNENKIMTRRNKIYFKGLFFLTSYW